jgi:hypothetical protein
MQIVMALWISVLFGLSLTQESYAQTPNDRRVQIIHEALSDARQTCKLIADPSAYGTAHNKRALEDLKNHLEALLDRPYPADTNWDRNWIDGLSQIFIIDPKNPNKPQHANSRGGIVLYRIIAWMETIYGRPPSANDSQLLALLDLIESRHVLIARPPRSGSKKKSVKIKRPEITFDLIEELENLLGIRDLSGPMLAATLLAYREVAAPQVLNEQWIEPSQFDEEQVREFKILTGSYFHKR